MNIRLLFPLCCALLMTACAQLTAPNETPPEADRRAILAMQGDYAVDFSFQETVPLAQAYKTAPPYRSQAHETVLVLADEPGHIALQHVLLHADSGQITKHWRQVWRYQAARRWEFAADQRWRWRGIAPEQVAGSWTQCVYEVSDAPRYCGTGRWQHEGGDEGGVSTWTSDPSWRPLPRREYSQRSDYNTLAAINRHTITPEGWSHEQDNTKVVRDAHGTVTARLAREFGFNAYRRLNLPEATDTQTDIDFSPVYRYWAQTADYWAQVRARWAARLADPHGVHLLSAIDGMAIVAPLFAQAQAISEGGTLDEAALDAVFAAWVRPDGD